MEHLKIAILIPVCNAERFLRQCLDSVLGQVDGSTGVFCRDDGSRDGSLAILREYAARHPNVHVAAQTNAGVVATRNRLLDGLPSEYGAFAFMDADDDAAPGMYARLREAMERTGADVAECEWDGEERTLDDMSVYLLRRTAPGQWINVINKLYRRSAVSAIRFREGLCFEEDYFYNFEVHQAVRRKVLVPGRFYHYRANPDSATHALNHRRYFESASRRIRLSLECFLRAGRVPAPVEPDYRRELAKDAYRMCLRKNLKKNADAIERRELFLAAGAFFREIERTLGFAPSGLAGAKRLAYAACVRGRYRLARFLVATGLG